MSLSVMIVLATSTASWTARWSRSVLTNEDRYLRAVARIPGSPRVARLSAWSLALAARSRRGYGVSPRTARLVAVATRRSMATRSFGRAWMLGNRWIHRGRGPDRRLAAMMLAMAATGELVGMADRLGAVRRRLASS